jgi:D-glycero-alpha-D-manno-heptose 1-phosphate guanylyltransferase
MSHSPIVEAIILAGGAGTRLREAVPDLPKCLAPVAGHPFLHYLLTYLQQQGIQRFVFSLGYRADIVQQYVQQEWPQLQSVFVTEASPLGTGGAIQAACAHTQYPQVLVANGDTIFKISVGPLVTLHQSTGAACTLSLKPLAEGGRYGSVTLGDTGRIEGFAEKKGHGPALINGGVYVLTVASFLQMPLQAPFSFEKDYLEAYCQKETFYGQEQDAYFIDIGIPADFERAGRELQGSG